MYVTFPVFLSHLFFFECLYQCPNVLSFILGVYVRILIRVSLTLFLWLFMSVFGYIVTDCTYIGISLIPRFCLSLCTCLSQCPGVLSVISMYVNKRVQLAHCVTALQKIYMIYDYYNSCVYMYVSWFVLPSHLFGSEFPFQSPDMLWLIVCAYMSLDLLFFFFLLLLLLLLNICISVRLNLSLIVGRCIFPSLDPCFSLSLPLSLSLSFSLNTSICVRLYCHWLHVNRYVSWFAFLSLSVSVSGILLVILRVYVSLLVRIYLSLFDSKCV